MEGRRNLPLGALRLGAGELPEDEGVQQTPLLSSAYTKKGVLDLEGKEGERNQTELTEGQSQLSPQL